MREKVINILKEINEDILTYDGNNLLGDGIIDSFQIIDIVSSIEEMLDIEFNPDYIVESNFRTVDAIVSITDKIMKGR